MLASGLWHFLAKADVISTFPLGLEEDEMRMAPQQNVGCEANKARPPREAAPGRGSSPAHTGIKARAEADVPQVGQELLRTLAGAVRAVGSVWARGDQAAGHFSDVMRQMSGGSYWLSGSFVPLGSSA